MYIYREACSIFRAGARARGNSSLNEVLESDQTVALITRQAIIRGMTRVTTSVTYVCRAVTRAIPWIGLQLCLGLPGLP